MSPFRLLARLLALLVLASAIAPSLADQPALGRLFLDPQQRARLDAQRQHNTGFQPDAGDQASQTINGEVRSSNGRRIRWINGEANWDQPAAPGVPVGDTFNPSTGERESLLRDGHILIKRGSPSK
ncbi:MAG: hypothetical protein CVU31_12660 [Betaproteobacteria bacterium HGW-Betaproteobacteria-4]|jgi:hypothetical protein|nr:MAG: hypothetical protein CVU31_12660 [Betaproteobacteria bacterium HGW-Betaproteobacteria-4]